jgi:ribose transport system permease protein
MGTLLGGIALGLNPIPIAGVSADLVDVVRHRFLGLQVSFYIALALCVLVWFIFEHTPTGRRLYFVGAGRSVARLSGIRVDRMRAGAFVTTAFLSAFAGIMFSGLVGASDSTIGPTFLLPALAAVFLGATAITPGRFNVWGTFIAVYFLVCGITGLELVGLSGWIVQVFYGGSLVVAVVMSRLLGMRLSGLREQR